MLPGSEGAPPRHRRGALPVIGEPPEPRYALLLYSLVLVLLCGFVSPAKVAAQQPLGAAVGPGTLLIVGGGTQPPVLVERFVELSGGALSRIAVIPLASSDPVGSGEGKVEHLQEYGGDAFVLLTDGADAYDPDVVARLDSATAVWFNGGDQARITDALVGSPLLEALRRRHREGMPIGGTSAGAAIMSPFMITGRQLLADEDTLGYHGDEFPRIGRGVMELVPGLGFLPGVIVDQHFVQRERLNRLLSAVLARPNHLGVGIDESTAIEVAPDGTWTVRGASIALVVDAREATLPDPPAAPTSPSASGAWSGAVAAARGIRLHILPPGSRYDPRTGEVDFPG